MSEVENENMASVYQICYNLVLPWPIPEGNLQGVESYDEVKAQCLRYT